MKRVNRKALQVTEKVVRIAVNKEKRMATNMSDIVTPTKETK